MRFKVRIAGQIAGNSRSIAKICNHEAVIENPRVGSSILSLGTNQFKDISGFCF